MIMEQYIKKSDVIAEIDKLQNTTMDKNKNFLSSYHEGIFDGLSVLENFLDTLKVKEVDLESENENNNHKITTGTKIRLKTNPNVILSIISTDCHEDEFECSNGSVLSLKQIEKYYDIYIDENNGK